MKAQPAQLVGNGALRDRGWIAAMESREMPAQVGCPKAVRELAERDDGMQQRMNARIGKAQAGGALAA